VTVLLLLLAQAAFAQTLFVPLEAVPVPHPISCALLPRLLPTSELPETRLLAPPETLAGLSAAPEVPLATRRALQKVLTDDIAWDGAERRARNEAARVVRAMTAKVEPIVLKRLVDRKVRLVLIPKDKKLTDMPQADYLKDQKTADGRRWRSVRGVADDKRVEGRFNVLVGEENLLSRIFLSGHPPRYLMVHEWAHAIQAQGLSFWEDAKFKAIYRSVRRSKLKLPDAYSGTNYFEFFAEMSSVWFGVWRSKYVGRRVGAEWIEENIPDLYDALARLYGPPREIRPR
jgi:hypothetical protein